MGLEEEYCDGEQYLCMFQDGCNENITCGEGVCMDGLCLPDDAENHCDAIMADFDAAANGCATIVVFDGLKKGFDCLHKYVNNLYGDCVHQQDPDMDECSHTLVIGGEIIHVFEHSIELLKTHPTVLVERLMVSMAKDNSMFVKMQ